MNKLASYHLSGLVSTKTASGNLQVRIESDFERPDKVRASTTIGSTTVESITASGQTWTKDPKSGAWKGKVTSTPTTPSPPGDPFAILEHLSNVRATGQEQIDGAVIDRIEGRAPAEQMLKAFPATGPPAPQGEALITVWVRRSDSVVVRITARTEGAATFALNAAFSRFGAVSGPTFRSVSTKQPLLRGQSSKWIAPRPAH